MENIATINRRLLETYGRGVAELPLYRVVWTTSQLERRYGTFIKETEAGIYLGQETCEREVPKYFMYPDFWVLEWIQPNIGNPELRAQVTYEPLYFFKDVENRPLPVDWEVLEFVCKMHQSHVIKRTQHELDGIEEDAKAKEASVFLDQLKGEASPFHGKLEKGSREAIVVPSNYGNK